MGSDLPKVAQHRGLGSICCFPSEVHILDMCFGDIRSEGADERDGRVLYVEEGEWGWPASEAHS